MKRWLMALLLSGVHSASVWAQNADFEVARIQAEVVLEDDFTIRSQEDLDGLIAAAGDSSFIITGNLTVEQSALTTLAGLCNLTSVGSLVIDRNAALTSLAALSNLTRVKSLTIRWNGSLTTLEGLNAHCAVRVGGTLSPARVPN